MKKKATADILKKTSEELRWKSQPRPTGAIPPSGEDSAGLDPWEIDERTKLIGLCIDRYKREFSHRRPASVYHVDEAINHLLTTLRLHENLSTDEITKERLITYKNALLAGTAPRGPRKRLAKAPTIAKKLSLIKAWLKWATNNGYMDRNPMDGLELPARMVASQKVKKAAFLDHQLVTILAAIAPEKTSTNLMRQEWFWVVLCLMFTGARLSEILQMIHADVRLVEGIWCFKIEGGPGKQLKNAVSERVVPVHSQLIEAGFLDWHHAQQTGTRLFPLLLVKRAVKVSHFFAYMLKKQKMKTPAISLHSFRHTFTREAREGSRIPVDQPETTRTCRS
jgi:integrase